MNKLFDSRLLSKVTGTMCVLAVVLACALFLSGIVEGNSADKISTPATAEGQLVLDESFTVAIDAGHGGSDGGAVGTLTGTPEAGINLSIAREVRDILTDAGFVVVMTRDSEDALGKDKDADMRARKAIVSDEGIDAVVSIHQNKFRDPSVHGTMVYYMQGSSTGESLALCALKGVCEATSQPMRTANPGDYFMIRVPKAPAIIVECGFLSNSSDEKMLLDADYQNKLASGIAQGLIDYFSNANGAQIKSDTDIPNAP